MSDLTLEQRKALIEAATQRLSGYSDAWERGFTDDERDSAAYYFLAGVKWAEKQLATLYLKHRAGAQEEKR